MKIKLFFTTFLSVLLIQTVSTEAFAVCGGKRTGETGCFINSETNEQIPDAIYCPGSSACCETLNECPQSPNYRCDPVDGCVQDPDGIYTSTGNCQDNCSVQPSYDCIIGSEGLGQCVTVPASEKQYGSLAECANQCLLNDCGFRDIEVIDNGDMTWRVEGSFRTDALSPQLSYNMYIHVHGDLPWVHTNGPRGITQDDSQGIWTPLPFGIDIDDKNVVDTVSFDSLAGRTASVYTTMGEYDWEWLCETTIHFSDSSTLGTPFGDFGEGFIDTAIGPFPISNTFDFVQYLFVWGISFVGGIAFLLFLIAGFMIISSAGDPKKLQAAKELFLSALGGLLLFILSAFILRVIGVDILQVLAS